MLGRAAPASSLVGPCPAVHWGPSCWDLCGPHSWRDAQGNRQKGWRAKGGRRERQAEGWVGGWAGAVTSMEERPFISSRLPVATAGPEWTSAPQERGLGSWEEEEVSEFPVVLRLGG